MKISLLLKFGAILLGGIVVFVFAFAAYVGAFHSIIVETKELGPFHLVYKEQIGDYRQTGATVSEVVRPFHNLGMQGVKGFGVFYDDPKKVAKENLKSEAGVILTEEQMVKAQATVSQYKTRILPRQSGAAVTFPFRNSLSPLVGLLRVYPVLIEYLVATGSKPGYSLEIYDFGQTITYFMPTQR